MSAHGQNLQGLRGLGPQAVGLRAGDRYLIINPFFHSFGYKGGWLACLIHGATALPHGVFDVADVVLGRIQREKITVMPGPPAIYQSMLAFEGREKYDTSSLRLAVTGAAPTPVELVHRMRKELGFQSVHQGLRPDRELRHGLDLPSRGRRRDDRQLRRRRDPRHRGPLMDAEGKEVPRGTPGEVWVRGYNVMRGYFNDEAETKKAIDADGWLHTGDIAVMDARGYLKITDRIKDMYIMGGFNVYPAEVESLLFQHPGDRAGAVIGVPDERMGEVGMAFVVPRPGHEARGRRGDRLEPRAHGELQGPPLRRGRGRAPEERARARSLKFELREKAAGGNARPGLMKIRGLGYIGFNATTLAPWRSFAEELLGFMPAVAPTGAAKQDDLYYRLDERSWRIAVHQNKEPGLAYIGWELADRDALAAAADHLDRCGVAIEHMGAAAKSAAAARGVSDLIAFADPDGNKHELFYGAPTSLNDRFVSPAGVSGFLVGTKVEGISSRAGRTLRRAGVRPTTKMQRPVFAHELGGCGARAGFSGATAPRRRSAAVPDRAPDHRSAYQDPDVQSLLYRHGGQPASRSTSMQEVARRGGIEEPLLPRPRHDRHRRAHAAPRDQRLRLRPHAHARGFLRRPPTTRTLTPIWRTDPDADQLDDPDDLPGRRPGRRIVLDRGRRASGRAARRDRGAISR